MQGCIIEKVTENRRRGANKYSLIVKNGQVSPHEEYDGWPSGEVTNPSGVGVVRNLQAGEFVAQRGARDAQQLGGLHLVPSGLFQSPVD